MSSKAFHFFLLQRPYSQKPYSGVVFRFQYGLFYEFYYGEGIGHLDKGSSEHIGLSPLTGKKFKPSNNNAVCDHLLHREFLPSFENFSILDHENRKCLFEIKESQLIMRDKASLNRIILSAPLILLEKDS